jgi:hypothetical protein
MSRNPDFFLTRFVNHSSLPINVWCGGVSVGQNSLSFSSVQDGAAITINNKDGRKFSVENIQVRVCWDKIKDMPETMLSNKSDGTLRQAARDLSTLKNRPSKTYLEVFYTY